MQIFCRISLFFLSMSKILCTFAPDLGASNEPAQVVSSSEGEILKSQNVISNEGISRSQNATLKVKQGQHIVRYDVKPVTIRHKTAQSVAL